MSAGDKNLYARKENQKATDNRQQQKDIMAPTNAITKAANDAIKVSQQTSDVKGNKANCNFCRKRGLQILPLRYTVTQSKAPQLPTLLGKNVKDVPLSYSKYTTEMVDTGYIYALIKRKKGFEWMGYIVTPMGYLSSFPLDKKAPASVQEFACKGNEHAVFASFVTVEYIADNLAEKAYLIYTHAPMTKAKREEYQSKADEYVTSGKWQKVNVTAWSGGSAQQEHCLDHTTLSGAVNQTVTFGANRWKDIVKKFGEKPKVFASVVLYDPVGITLKLNEYRNEAYVPVDDYLEKKDAKGVSNQRKIHSVQRINTLKSDVIDAVRKSSEARELDSRERLELPLKGQIEIANRTKEAALKRGDYKVAASAEANKQRLLKEYQALVERRLKNNEAHIETQTRANLQICDDNINFTEVESFKKEAGGVFKTAQNVANQRSQEHLNWIKSDFLLDAFDAYDQKDLQSGCFFKAHVASILFGMEGADASAKQVDEWIKKSGFERGNLFIRGLYSNQLEAKAKHDEAKKYATDFTAVGVKAIKTTIDFLKKMDSAWDEWARNQDIDPDPTKNKNHWNGTFKRPEKVVMLFISNLARAVFRLGMGSSAESRFVKAISQKLLFAQLGKFAEKLRFDQIIHNIDPETQKIGKNYLNPEFSQRVSGQLSKATKEATLQSIDVLMDDAMVKKHSVILTLDEIEELGSKGMVNHTNNYHQVRASGILVFLEAINLAHMLKSGKYQDKAQIAALVASVSALMAFGLDIFYGLAKGVREVASHSSYGGAGAAATRGAANIQRAAIKWVAGSLSAFAGGINASLDTLKAIDQYNRIDSLWILYATRAATGYLTAALGLFAALTYIGPLMKYLARVGGSPAIQQLGTKLFGSTAIVVFNKMTREIVRNSLLRGIAWLSGIGLILTIAEVGILIVMDVTKLKRWCEHSAFRKDKNKDLMPEKQEAEDFQALFA